MCRDTCEIAYNNIMKDQRGGGNSMPKCEKDVGPLIETMYAKDTTNVGPT